MKSAVRMTAKQEFHFANNFKHLAFILCWGKRTPTTLSFHMLKINMTRDQYVHIESKSHVEMSTILLTNLGIQYIKNPGSLQCSLSYIIKNTYPKDEELPLWKYFY